MPHNTLRLQGGVVVNETPVLNQAGIASCNRIRFKYDPQGLTLVEKLGGWARFYVNAITSGIVRALWAWQDTSGTRWLAYAADSSTLTTNIVVGAIPCSTNPTTGITTGHNPVSIVQPTTMTSMAPVSVQAISGSNIFQLKDPNFIGLLNANNIYTVYITNPIAVAGIVLQGQYSISSILNAGTGTVNIAAYDILGNPLNAKYSTNTNGISGGTFTAGTPNTITFTGSFNIPVNDFINIIDSTNTVSGTYQVLAETPTTIKVATTLSSYTFSGTVTGNNFGTVPIFTTSNQSIIVNYFLPNHNLLVGDPIYVLNPTAVGQPSNTSAVIQGTYTVQSVIDTANVTFNTSSAATATTTQYQGAIPSLTSNGSGSAVTLTFPTLYADGPNNPYPINTSYWIRDFQPSTFSGIHTVTSYPTTTSVIYTATTSAGPAAQNGTFSPIGGFGVYVYSVAGDPFLPGSPIVPTTQGTFWTLDNWGNDLIMCPGNSVAFNYPTQPLLYQPIFYWDSTAGITAQAIPNAPVASFGAFVAMPQRQIIAWGSTFSGILDPLEIRWCDINNFNTWVAQPANQAGSFRLSSGASIMGGRQVGTQALIWTDIEVWSMQYINQPYVYSFNKIGQGCGLIGKYAHGVLSGITYWMSKTQFFMLSGDGVVAIPCPIWDVVFQDLDQVNIAKITCAPNSMFQEISWYFPIIGGNGENSHYIKLNVSGLVSGQGPLWDYGTLDRSAWIDVSILQQPIGYSPLTSFIYQHEISPDFTDSISIQESFTTGWFSIADGDQMPFVDQIWPDFKWGYFAQAQTASVNLTLNGQDFPGQSSQGVGPFTVTQATTWISPRIRHRLVSFTVAGVPNATGVWWRCGGIRYRFQADGKF